MARAAPSPPAFWPLQHPKLVDAPPGGTSRPSKVGESAWRHEVKWDGYRTQLHVQAGRCTWFSRNGNDWSDRYTDLSEEAGQLRDCILDGEIIAFDDKGDHSFSTLRSALGRRQAGKIEGHLIYMVFDILKIGKDDIRSEPLRLRLAQLEYLLEPRGKPAFELLRMVDALPGGGPELLKAAAALGIEGIVSKRLDAPYQGGENRPLTWQKSKCRPTQELVVGGYRTEGSRVKNLLGGVYRRGKFTYVGSVAPPGSGREADRLMKELRRLEAERSPFEAGKPSRSRGEDIHYCEPETVIEIQMAEFTGSGKLRQPSFQRVRDDKRAEDVVDERPEA